MQPPETAALSAPSLFARVRLTLDMIRFEHSVFALPFALTGALLAWRSLGYSVDRWGLKLLWIVVAMVGARSAAMAFNRILDASIDARNPRTQSRHLPAGLLTPGFAWAFTAASAAVFIGAAAMLNPLCLRLSPVALGVVLFYSWTKRFTALSHLVLGFALGIAPAAAWIAMTGALDARILWLTAAVTLWTAGFDVIYSCQDYDFDVREGLFSIPAKLGIHRALIAARLLHLGMLACLVAMVPAFGFTTLSLPALSVALTALLLGYEHSLVRHDDLSKVNAAFFTVNGWIGMLFFLLWAIGVWREQI